MKYGPNTSLVDEVIESMAPETLMADIFEGRKPSDRVATTFDVIGDIEEARRLATHQNVIFDGFAEWAWIREIEVAPLLYPTEPITPDYRAMSKEIEELSFRFHDEAQELRRAFPTRYGNHGDLAYFFQVISEIYCDFRDIALARMQLGAEHRLFETMFAAYKQGGWPCGWRGEYPDGRIVVYHVGPKA